MSEQKESVVKKGMPKKLVSILVIALIVCGGGVVAFLAMGTSDKAKYFKAEVDTYSFIEEQVRERFNLELDWLEVTENNPTESTLDISAQFNDPGFFGYGMMIDIEELINNSNIFITSEAALKDEQMTAKIDANIAGLEFSGFNFGLTGEYILLDLPFLNDVLKLEGKDTGKLLHMIDPYTFDEDVEINFSSMFESSQSVFTEKDKEHFKKEYGQMIYDDISDDAFTSEKESIEIDGEKIKAEKIEMALSNEDVKQLFKAIFEKMKSDDHLKELMRKQFEMNFMAQGEIDELIKEFEEALDEGIKEIDTINLPNGLTSTIWIDSGLIVQRSFEIVAVDENDEEMKTEIFGTQILNKEVQKVNYDITLDDSYDKITFNLTGDFSHQGEDIKDNLTIDFDDFKIGYEANETLKNSERQFTRSISFDDGWTKGALVWTGDNIYEKDQMEGSHQLFIEADGIGKDLFTLHLDVTGKKIKEVEMINDENSLNIGEMSEQELFEYIEYDASEQFMEWYFETFGELAELLY